jgi:alcohol dehydrogenase (cytochrome c)
MKSRYSALAMIAAMIAVAASTRAPGAESTPPGGLWGSYNKTLDGQRYSPLQKITLENVGSLKETCRLPIAARGTFEAGPVVTEGTMYVTTSTETVALNPVNCALKWKHVYVPEQNEVFPVNRGVAYQNGRIFRGTVDGRLLALDAESGKVLWIDVVGNPAIGEYISGAPIAWNGMVFVGTASSESGIKGRIVGYRADSGLEVWRFDTIPSGNEIGANSWKSNTWVEHGGGGTWSHFALDPTTAELFVPVGNPEPDFSPDDRPGANLFTDSVVVLDARSGALKWWYQLAPHDGRDRDLAAAPMLYRNGRQRDVVAVAGKDGYVHVVDRVDHKLLFKTAITTIYNEGKSPVHGEFTRFCPGPAGGVEWNGPAFDPAKKMIVVGAVDYCAYIAAEHADFKTGEIPWGGRWQLRTERGSGWVTALDSDTGEVRWRYHADSPVVAGVTATAGGLVVTGDNDGNFIALASEDGRLLKKIPTGGSLSGGVVTYEQAGKQYIAFASGNVSRTGFGAVGRPTLIVMEAEDLAAKSETPTPDRARGLRLFRQMCAQCHGSDGSLIEGFNLKGLNQRMNAERLKAWIENPAPPMPRVFPTPLDVDEKRDLDDLVVYLQDAF